MAGKSRFSDSDRTVRNLPGDHSNGECHILDVYSPQQYLPRDYASPEGEPGGNGGSYRYDNDSKY